MNNSDRNDAYLISKFARLQEAAKHAQADIAAIPADASVDVEFDAVRCAIAPVERHAQMIMLTEARTAAGVAAKDRVEAWLAGERLDSLLSVLEEAA